MPEGESVSDTRKGWYSEKSYQKNVTVGTEIIALTCKFARVVVSFDW